jgi:hypothetical protein
MAKIPKNAEKFKIRWNGDVEGGETDGDSIPSSVTLPTWSAGKSTTPYVPCWDVVPGPDYSQCTDVMADLYFEDIDIYLQDGEIAVLDAVAWVSAGRGDIASYILANISDWNSGINVPANGPPTVILATETEFTWGDVAFIQEIADGIGTGSRRARQDRLNKILDDEDKKKKLIHLICRIKGEKVYDDYTEVGSVEVNVDDVELIVESMMGKKLTLEIKSGV